MQRLLQYPRRWTAAAAALLILASAIHVGAIAWETRKLRNLLGDLDQTGSAMAAIQPKADAMMHLHKYRIDVEAIVAEMCQPIPSGIIISSIKLGRDGKLTIKGTSGNPKEIFSLADALRNSDRFGRVNPDRTEPGKGGGFTITAELVSVESLPSFAQRGGRWR